MIRLIDESRHREALVEMIRDAPARRGPATALELRERARCNSMLIDLRSLGDPDEVAAPDPGPATLQSEPEVEQATATLTYAPMTKNAMTGARRGRKRAAGVRLLLCLGMLVFLCLGVLVFLGLGTWGVTDASIYLSLGL